MSKVVVRLTREEVARLYELSQTAEMVQLDSTETGIGQGHNVTCLHFGEDGWEAMGDSVDITDYSNW